MSYRIIAVLLAALAAAAGLCETDYPERRWERGEFRPDPGREWDLPSGLAVGSIVGWEDEIQASLLPLQMSVRNFGGTARSVTMPAGLCFRPRDPEYAWMLLIQDFTFEVPPDDTTVLLPTWSAHYDLDEPDDEMIYALDLVAEDREMRELFDLLRDKTIDDSIVYLDDLQDAVWEITDEDGLTDSTRVWLQGLP